MSVIQQPVLRVKLNNATMRDHTQSCQNIECNKFNIEDSNQYCGFCGTKIIKKEISRNIEVSDLINSCEHSELLFFQDTGNESYNFNHYENDVHKDKNKDVLIYDSAFDRYTREEGNDYISIFKELSEEEKSKDLDTFTQINKPMIDLLNISGVSFEIETMILSTKS
jgi:hypothetical protein